MSIQILQSPVRPVRSTRLAVVLLFVVVSAGISAEETNLVSVPESPTPADMVGSYLRLQEQLHATQLALEQNRKEAEAFAARNSEAVASRLEQIEQALNSQQTREAEASKNASRILFTVASAFAGLGFIALLLTAYLLWRTANRLAGLSPVLAGVAPIALPGAVGPLASDASNTRLLGALDRLEQRILELEHPRQLTHEAQSASASVFATTTAPAEPEAARKDSGRMAILLGKGQSMLSLGQPEAAIRCFDEILAQHPDHPEALVKKGMALEHQNQDEDALRCYDRAIAADGNLTLAYLQKAGLCNRLEQFDQAVKCYEQILRVQEKRQKAQATTAGIGVQAAA